MTTTPLTTTTVRTSPGTRQRIERRTVYVLSPGGSYSPGWTNVTVKVHTVHLEYTENGTQGVLAKIEGHRVLTTGELSKTADKRDPVPADWPDWLRQAALDYAPEWFITPAWLEGEQS